MLNELSAKELGAKLKELREYHGYTQQEIVKLLGVGRAVYGMYESGERTINIKITYCISILKILSFKPQFHLYPPLYG